MKYAKLSYQIVEAFKPLSMLNINMAFGKRECFRSLNEIGNQIIDEYNKIKAKKYEINVRPNIRLF